MLNKLPQWLSAARSLNLNAFVASFSTRILGSALSFASAALMARSLGIRHYGELNYWLSVAGLANIVASLGVPILLTRNIANARGSRNPNQIATTLFLGISGTALSTIALMTIGFFLYAAVSGEQDLVSCPPFIAFLVASIAQAASLPCAILAAYEKVALAQAINLLTPAVVTLGAFILSTLNNEVQPAAVGLWITAAANLIFLFVNIATLMTIGRAPFVWPALPRPLFPVAKAFIISGATLAGSQLLVNSITQIDVIMLSWLSTNTETAHYYAGSRIAYVVSFFFGSVSTVAAPTFARLISSGGNEKLRQSAQQASLIAFSGTVLIAAAIILLSDRILLAFGTDFTARRGVMLILVSSWILQSFLGLSYALLNMGGHAALAFWKLGTSSVINIVLAALLIPVIGAEGAAIASLASTLYFSIQFSRIVYRKYAFRLDAYSCLLALRSLENSRP
jgi:O-antigen/teichoic acid export membrane protein